MNSKNSKNPGFLGTNLMRKLPQWLIWGSCKNLHNCNSTLVISETSLSSAPIHLAPFHRLQTCLGFFLLLPLLVVMYQNQPSNIVELQQHSPISNSTLVTTYVHRMIISPPCLFKYLKNGERVAMLFQCLLDHTQHKLYFCVIPLLINNVSKSIHQFETLCIYWNYESKNPCVKSCESFHK